LLAFEEPEWSELVDPGLSVIRQPVREIVRVAWDLLLRRMGGESGPSQHVQLKAELVLRGSVRRATPRR
jgi:DNA-binding LacI/PurR family transcriptional regulator